MARRRSTRRWARWVVAAAAVAITLAVALPYIYINVIQGDAPDRLAVAADHEATDTTSGGAGASLDGTWTVASGSQAGYRVKEVLFGQSTEAVGRTTAVTGQLTVTGSNLQAAPTDHPGGAAGRRRDGHGRRPR
jgi:hypothetical protein